MILKYKYKKSKFQFECFLLTKRSTKFNSCKQIGHENKTININNKTM